MGLSMTLNERDPYREYLDGCMAAGLLGSDFAKEMAAMVVREDRTRPKIDRLIEAFAQTHEEVETLWGNVRIQQDGGNPTETREVLLGIAATAWRSALQLGLAARPESLEPDRAPPASDGAVDHPLLDVIFGLLDLMKPGWTVARLPDRLQFSERDDPAQAFELVLVPLARDLDDESEGA